ESLKRFETDVERERGRKKNEMPRIFVKKTRVPTSKDLSRIVEDLAASKQKIPEDITWSSYGLMKDWEGSIQLDVTPEVVQLVGKYFPSRQKEFEELMHESKRVHLTSSEVSRFKEFVASPPFSKLIRLFL